MNCPNCGATVNTKFCEFCGAQITAEMQKEQEQLNKKGCPKCGSSNIHFKRENHGELKGKKSNTVIHKTVGLCKDCGATWYPDNGAEKKKGKLWLWVLGWIFIFPVPLTILMLRKKDMKPAIKYAIIAVAWIFYLWFVFIRPSNNTETKTTKSVATESSVDKSTVTEESESVVEETVVEETKTAPVAETEPEPVVETEPEDNTTLGQKNALAKAHQYLEFTAFSYTGLISQLEFEGFSTEEATYAVDNCGADWNEQAGKKAQEYINFSSFSRSGLIDQLKYEGFTAEQAEYGVTVVGY